jgi:ribulose 1,5-bisphosphate synthetase/thiazole synthase
MTARKHRRNSFVAILIAFSLSTAEAQESRQYDIVIYGGTSAGVAAAVQAARMGKTVVVLEPNGQVYQ